MMKNVLEYICDKSLYISMSRVSIKDSKVAYWISPNIAIAILEFFSIAPPLVIALPTIATAIVVALLRS